MRPLTQNDLGGLLCPGREHFERDRGVLGREVLVPELWSSTCHTETDSRWLFVLDFWLLDAKRGLTDEEGWTEEELCKA